MDRQPLDFEKPIFELQRRLQDFKNHSDEARDRSSSSEVKTDEEKIRETRREIYDNLTAWQRVQIARHTQRPFALDYIGRCFTEWVELHGDRRLRRRSSHALRSGQTRAAALRRHHPAKRPQHERKRETQFRLRLSRRLSQGAAVHAAGGEIRAAGDFINRHARRFPGSARRSVTLRKRSP